MPVPRLLRRLRWPILTLLALVATLFAFHRPLVFELTRRLLVRTAADQQLRLTYELGGSIFTTLRVTNVVADPDPDSPIRKLTIGEIGLQYSLLGWVKDGYPGLLKSIRLTNFDLEIDQSKFTPRPQKRRNPKTSNPQNLETLKFPLLFPERVEITNFSFISRSANGDFTFTGFTLLLLPDRPGTLRVGRFQAPGSPTFENLEGRTTFTDRNLILTDLAVGPGITINRFNFDASHLAESRLGLAADVSGFGGTAHLDIAIHDIYETNHSSLRLKITGIELDRVGTFLNLVPAPTGTIADLTLNYEGELFRPLTWTGEGRAEFTDLQLDQPRVDHLLAVFTLADGRARIDLRDLRRDVNTLTGQLVSNLPATIANLPPDNYAGTITLDAPDLSTLVPGVAPLALGTITGSGRLDYNAPNLSANLKVEARRLDFQDLRLANADLAVTFSKKLPPPGASEPITTNLTTRLGGRAATITYQNYEADEAIIELSSAEKSVALEKLELNYQGNFVRLVGSYEVPTDPTRVNLDLLDLKLEIDAPRLEDFVRDTRGTVLSGSLKVDADIHRENQAFQGGLHVTATNLSARGYTIPAITIDAPIADNVANVRTFEINLGPANAITASGTADLTAPYAYRGQLTIDLADLTALVPPERNPINLGGQLALTWSGSGEVENTNHSGEFALTLTDARTDQIADFDATAVGTYTPTELTIPTLTADLRGQRILTGHVTLPLDLNNNDQPIPRDRPLDLAVSTPELTVTQLAAIANQPAPPLLGAAQLNLTAKGTLTTLVADLHLTATDLQPEQLTRIEPAQLDLRLSVAEGDARLAATFQQRRLEPVTINGSFPFIPGEPLDPDTPINLRIGVPGIDLALIPTFAPAISFVEGNASARIEVGGTLQKPVPTGAATLQIKRLALAADELPEVTNVDARLDLSREKIAIRNFTGNVSGGQITLTGFADLTDPESPQLDFTFDGQSLLLARSPDLLARANANLTLTGPPDSAKLSGHLGLIDSRLFKQIVVLPFGQPGKRKAPQAPSADPPRLSFPNPPIRDWQFDVTIGTDSPFLIRGNLANGRATADLRLTGTGLAPRLEGSANVEDLILTLPFSTLDIANGSVYFNPADPLDPVLNLRGRSEIRDYVITVLISGTANDPEVTFTSNPPLPPEDIVALLSTGATAKELTGGTDVIAGRAALLLLQQLYQRFFPAKPGETDSFRDKFDLEVGAIDPKTGKQSLSARYRLTPAFHLIGDLDVNGDFRGRLRYVLRLK